ncbi:uncharacterized protein LOC110584262 [Neomonachus schauinslandi]|uniref:Uncharacterized protein LOC110584262 n=1 Tax=Neomonachus schauinslandi TaxID=29088 RepID=A0A2Y9HE08_NEOSC|nr:uncharacterized protein LOC110584262 [Neomonachus schauinslandi]
MFLSAPLSWWHPYRRGLATGPGPVGGEVRGRSTVREEGFNQSVQLFLEPQTLRATRKLVTLQTGEKSQQTLSTFIWKKEAYTSPGRGSNPAPRAAGRPSRPTRGLSAAQESLDQKPEDSAAIQPRNYEVPGLLIQLY